MGKLFGTDGVRGIAGKEVNCDLALKIGKTLPLILGEGRYVIAKDTRISGDALSSSVASGLASMGADIIDLGVFPTPGLAWFAKNINAAGAVMISASHNPWEYNGIKVFAKGGNKLFCAQEELIEKMILETPIQGDEVYASISKYTSAGEEYSSHLASLINCDISDLNIAVDCANGASVYTAPLLFEKLGCRTTLIADSPNGKNINKECGSTDMANLCKYVKDNHLACGIAFDGDADRCLFADDSGNILDGDIIMALCAGDLSHRGKLNNNIIIATIMSNLGLMKFCSDVGITVKLSEVGDKNVADMMKKYKSNFGGEQSGHIIFGEYSETGDGLLTAIQLLSILKRSGKKLSELARQVPKYPQIERSVTVSCKSKKAFFENSSIQKTVKEAESLLSDSGRLVVRPSGTEACIRIMAQGPEGDKVLSAVDMITKSIKTNLK